MWVAWNYTTSMITGLWYHNSGNIACFNYSVFTRKLVSLPGL